MKLTRTFIIEAGETDSREQFRLILERAGYRPAALSTLLHYQRGSRWGSFLSFSPRDWQTTVRVDSSPVSAETTELTLNFEINTTGQLVTEKERAFWQGEIERLQAAAQGNEPGGGGGAGLERVSFRENILAFLVIAGLATGFGVIGRLALASGYGALGGILLGLAVGGWVARRWLRGAPG